MQVTSLKTLIGVWSGLVDDIEGSMLGSLAGIKY